MLCALTPLPPGTLSLNKCRGSVAQSVVHPYIRASVGVNLVMWVRFPAMAKGGKKFLAAPSVRHGNKYTFVENVAIKVSKNLRKYLHRTQASLGTLIQISSKNTCFCIARKIVKDAVTGMALTVATDAKMSHL